MRERDSEYLLSEQYRTGSNLQARYGLYERFSAHPQALARWIFDQLDLSPTARVLELGCGNGLLWKVNASRVPRRWRLTLSDLSEGMVRETQARLRDSRLAIEYRVADAQALPFPAQSFDGVIANYMLYHVPILDAALREIARVLTATGRLYAATTGSEYLQELRALFQVLDPEADYRHRTFTLENGEALLRARFGKVVLRRYEDFVEVTDPDAIAAFVLSTVPKEEVTVEATESLAREVRRQFAAAGGSVHLTYNTGMFEAWEPRSE